MHEINALVQMADAISINFSVLRVPKRVPQSFITDLAEVRRSTNDLKDALDRDASYLVDIVSADARRRRVRQSVLEAFDAAQDLVRMRAQGQGILIFNSLKSDIHTRPMFRSELSAILTNIFTNAVKSAGRGGRIRISGSEKDGITVFTVENTGTRIDIKESEKWFAPYLSTSDSADPVLGHGMGLGLTITRTIVEEYGGNVRFVEPSGRYATAIRVEMPSE